MKQPLLIGGATTSRVHTAVKIAPHYGGVTVYVPDASRAVGVASNLLSDDLKDGYVAEVAADYEKIRVQHAGKKGPKLVTLAKRARNAFATDWAAYAPPVPRMTGRREFRNVDLAEIAPSSTGARSSRRGSCPARIRRSSTIPSWARPRATCYAEGQAMLRQIIEGRWLTASGVMALWPARARGRRHRDLRRRARKSPSLTWHNLRQQNERPRGQAQLLPGRLRGAGGVRARRLDRRLRGHGGSRHRAQARPVRGGEGRLQRHHAEGARRSAGRGVRRMAAREGAARALGLRGRRVARRHRRWCARSIAASARRRAIRPVPIMP